MPSRLVDPESINPCPQGAEQSVDIERLLVEDGLGLYVVCDGASDSAAGEVAARLARDAVAASVARSEEEVEVRHDRVARFVVEKALKAVQGVDGAEVELEPGSATVTGESIRVDDLVEAVDRVGFTASAG